MKYLLLLALCTMATGFMTSCLNSDDNGFDSKFTEEELSEYLTRLNGTYSGKLMFYHRGTNKAGTQDSMLLDSIEYVRWTIRRDSTIVIDDFPDSIYNNAITGNSDFRAVLAEAPARQLKCTYAPYKGLTQDNVVDYGFYVLPEGTVKNVESSNGSIGGSAMYNETQITDGNKTYNVEYGYVTYAIDGYYSYQANGYLKKNNDLDFMLIMKDVKCQDTQSFTTTLYPILLKGTKTTPY